MIRRIIYLLIGLGLMIYWMCLFIYLFGIIYVLFRPWSVLQGAFYVPAEYLQAEWPVFVFLLGIGILLNIHYMRFRWEN